MLSQLSIVQLNGHPIIKSTKDSPVERFLIVGHGLIFIASTLLGYKEPLLRKDGGLAKCQPDHSRNHDFETFISILGMILPINK